jgi:hypothetical protein
MTTDPMTAPTPDRIWIDRTVPGQPWRVWTIEMTDLPEYVSRDVVDALLRRAKREGWEAGRDAAAAVCVDRSDYLSDAIIWGGSKAYITSLKGGVIELGNVGPKIRALTPPPDLGAEKETGDE